MSTEQVPEQVPGLLRPAQAARYIGVSKSAVHELIKSGELASDLLAPRVRVIPRAACDAYIRRKTEEAAQATGAPVVDLVTRADLDALRDELTAAIEEIRDLPDQAASS